MSGSKGARILKWTLLTLCVLVVLAGGTLYVLFYQIDRLLDVEGRLADAISEATNGLYRTEVDTVVFDADGDRIYAENLRIWPDLETWEADDKSPPFYRYEIILPIVEINGLAELTMLMRRALVADSVYLGRPQVHVFSLPPDSSTQDEEEDDQPFRIHARVGERLDGVLLNTLAIEQGLLSYTREGPDTVLWSDSLRGVDLRFLGLAIDESRADDPDHVLFSEEIEVVIAPHTRWFADSLYTLTLGEITTSARDGIVSIDTLAYEPTVSDVQLNRRRGHRKGRYKIEVGQLDMRDLGFRGLIENEQIGAREIEIDGFLIDYADDMRFPPGPSRGAKPMPHDLVRRLQLPLHIDSLRVRQARVMYSRYAPDGVRPGRLPFTDVSAVFYNISSDSARMSDETPTLAYAEGRIAGAGRLHVDMEYNLLSPTFDLSYQGGLEPMNLTQLNVMLEPGVGIKLREGQLQSLSFDVRARDGRSRGTVNTRYRDLSVQIVNPDGTPRNIAKQFKSFIANQFVIKTANPMEDEPLRTGTVAYVHEPREPFFRFLWKSLRSGLADVTGMER